MKTINVKFINFWPGFDELGWFNHWKRIFYHSNIIWTNNSSDPDLVISSVFGSIDSIQNFNCKKILYVRENLNFPSYLEYKNNTKLFDMVIGFKDIDNQINIPWYYELFNLYQLDIYKSYIPKNANRKNLSLISKNPEKLRLQLLLSFKDKQYIVDCPSIVGKNMDIVVHNKIDFIKNYYFNICPENSYDDGYITEKLFDCCVAGCIPIYYGCEKLNDGFYNKDRILHIKKDLSNYDDVIIKTIYLLNNKNELLEFMNQNPFTIHIQNHINQIKTKIKSILEQLI